VHVPFSSMIPTTASRYLFISVVQSEHLRRSVFISTSKVNSSIFRSVVGTLADALKSL